MGYNFIFMYDGDENSRFCLPLPPETFRTEVGGENKVIELIQSGQFNIIKNIGLREFSFRVLLPRGGYLGGYDVNTDVHEPIFYMEKFREFKASKKPVRMIITRDLSNGEKLFGGNILVSFENYSVEENAGEEGDFWVEFSLKEYRPIQNIVLNISSVSTDGTVKVSAQSVRQSKSSAKVYTVKKGDNLWKIAKMELNDGSRYSEIAKLNNIANSNYIDIGMVLKLPE